MQPHAHTGLNARIFLVQTSFSILSIFTNIQNFYRNTTCNLLPSFPACNTVSTYTFCMAEEKYEAGRATCVVPTIKALMKKKKSNPRLCYCYYLNCILTGKKFLSFSDIHGKVLRTYDLTPETNNYNAGKYHSTAPLVLQAKALAADMPAETLPSYRSACGKT